MSKIFLNWTKTTDNQSTNQSLMASFQFFSTLISFIDVTHEQMFAFLLHTDMLFMSVKIELTSKLEMKKIFFI